MMNYNMEQAAQNEMQATRQSLVTYCTDIPPVTQREIAPQITTILGPSDHIGTGYADAQNEKRSYRESDDRRPLRHPFRKH